MKIAKKSLSVLLAIMMVVTSISVCFSTFVFAAESTYTVDQVKELVAAAVSGDSEAKWKAAEAVFDFATKEMCTAEYGLALGDNTKENAATSPIGSEKLASAFINRFKYTANSNEANFVNGILNPSGDALYAYGQNQRTGSYSFFAVTKYNPSVGTDYTNDTNCPSSLKSNWINPVARVSSVTRSVTDYLMSIDDLNAIPDSGFATKVTYTFNHDVNRFVWIVKVTAAKNFGTNKGDVAGCCWHYLSTVNRAESNINTTAKGELLSAKSYFEEKKNTAADSYLSSYNLGQLISLRDEISNKYNSLVSSYSAAVINKHVNSDINAVLYNLNEAINRLNNAATNMRNMIAYINAGFTPITTENVGEVNIDEYNSLYAAANAAFVAVNGLPDATVESVKSGAADLASFSKADSKAWLDSLNESISLYNAVQLKATIDNAYALNNSTIADKYVSEDVISNDAVALLKSNIGALVASFAKLTQTAKETVFGAVTYAELDELQSNIITLSAVRDAETDYSENFYQYFEPKFNENIGEMKNAEITALYDEAFEKKEAYVAAYNGYVQSLGQDTVDTIFFDVNYNGDEVSMAQAANAYVESLKTNIISRNRNQLSLLKEYSDVPYVDFNNITAVKNATSRFDQNLYDFNEAKGWLTNEDVSEYNLSATVIEKVKAFIATGGLDFEELHHHDADGVFTVREADSNTDIARKDGEDYAVTESNINETITKLDRFITSKDFTSLVGLENPETHESYEDLTTAITEILNEKLFSDEMVNTLIGTIYPMLAETLGGLFNDLSSIAPDVISPSPDPDSVGRIDLATLSSDMGGTLDLYFNGKKGTDSLLKDLDNLGLRLYPKQLAEMPAMAKYPEIKELFENAGTGWRLITEDPDNLDEKGNLNLVWGVHDYDSFIEVVSMIFDSIGPLLTALISGKDYSDSLGDKAAYAVVKDLKYSIISGIDTDAYAKAKIEITGQNLFQTLWIPAMEALGVTDYTAQGYTFANINANSSYNQIADAMFRPLLELINQLSKQPIDKVMSIIPNLMYLLSMDFIQSTLNNISIPLKVSIEVSDFKGGGLISGALNLFKGTVNGALPKLEPELILGNLVDLQDLLGFDLSNVNAVFDFVLETIGIDAHLPVLNAGQFVLASHATTATSQRPSGTRNTLVADKADVFYLLLDYLMKAVGDRELVDAIIDFVVASKAEDGEEAETIEIPEIVYTILANVNGNTEKALAAIIELINPIKYETMSFDWYESPFSYSSDVEDFDESSLPYLKYSNEWTKEKADYLIENIDEIFETVLSVAGVEDNNINAALQEAVSSLFTNLNFTGFVQMLVQLGYMIDNEFVYDLIAREFNLDLRTWAKTFGDSFPEVLEKIKEDNPNREISETFPDRVPVIEGVTFDKETGIWTINGKDFADGDRDTFLDLFTTVCASFADIIAALFTGEDITLFNNAITILGYDNYKNSIGILFEILGMSNPELKDALGEYYRVRTQDEYAAMAPADAFNFLTKQLFKWLDYMFEGNTVAKIIELIPRFVYFFESNGLATVMHNMIKPILVLLDVARPIIDIDVNAILSTLISDLLNSVTDAVNEGNEIEINIDVNRILDLLAGTGTNDLNPDHKSYSININQLKTGDLHTIVDTLLGTTFATSPIVTYCVPGLCAGRKEITQSVIGTAYGSDVTAADTVTILVSALLETLQTKCYDEFGAETTNGLVVCSFIQKILDSTETDIGINIADVYNAAVELVNGIEAQYKNPDWTYMFSGSYDIDNGSITLPDHTINYLQYDNDWTEESAKILDENFDALVDFILNEVLKDNDLAGMINSILEDNVYKDENLNMIVELLVKTFAQLDESIRELLGVALDVNISDWFDMCEIEKDEDGNITNVTCTENFGVNEATDKKVAFIDAIKTVLAPASRLLGWIFFDEDYNLFIGSEKDKDGNYIYNDLITIGGGKGYAYGIVPVLEALGCDVKAADEFLNEETGKYDVESAVDSIINALLDRVDEIAGKPAHEVLNLIPNLIYFINADGITTVLNNITACLDALVSKVGPVVGQDNVTVLSILKDIIGKDVSDLSMSAIIDLISELTGVIISEEQKGILESFYIGKISQFESVNGEYAFKMEYTDEESRADMITIILSFAIEFIKNNRVVLADAIGEELYDTIVELLAGYDGMFIYKNPNWAYMYEGENALESLVANGLPARDKEAYANYTKYTNNWNKETASYLTENLQAIADDLIAAITESDTTVGVMIENAVAGQLYTDAVLNKLLETVVKLLAGLDTSLVKSVGAVLGADLDTWFDWCEIEKDAEGNVTNVTCTKDWGIDSKLTNASKKDAFVAAFTEAVAPANRVLAWLFLGKDYTFLNDANGEDLITINGGEGYDFAIVPILEALSCENVKGAIEYRDAEGNYDVSAIVGDVLVAICDKISDICNDKTVDSIIDLLPNVIYFVNADGINTVVNNLLVPVDYLLEKLEPVVGEVDLEEMIGFPIRNITFEVIFDLLADKLGINLKAESKEFIETFYMGKVEAFESANGRTAYRMTYSEDETSREMITIILSLLLENIRYEKNKDALTDLLGEDVYQSINAVLSIMKAKEMQEFSWLYTEYADTDKTFSATESSMMYDVAYNEPWTKDKAQYIADNFGDFVNKLIKLLGLEVNGVQIKDLTSFIDEFVNGNLYTQENVDSIIELFRNVVSNLTKAEPYGKYIVNIAKTSIGVDLTAWDNMNITVTDGSRDDFANAIATIIKPLAPLFKVLLVGEDFKFFYDIDGRDQIVIPGSEGYAYGIIPLLEALGCKNVLTPDKFAAVLNVSEDEAIKAVINPVLDKLEDISTDPANKLLEMLPGVVYFIDSNGLDTSVKNILNSIDTVLAALEPIIGASDVLSLAGIELTTYNFDWIVNFVLDLAKDATGYDFTPLAMDAIAELITGKVVSYKSANGETYYTMKYASKGDKADMVTVLLRLFVSFVLSNGNLNKVEEAMHQYIKNDKVYEINCKVLEFLAEKALDDPSMCGILAVIYYIYFGLNSGVIGADNLYNEINDSWLAVLKGLENDRDPVMRVLGEELKVVLDKYLDGIIDSDGVAPDGMLTFWQRIVEFFKNIFNFFKNMFK